MSDFINVMDKMVANTVWFTHIIIIIMILTIPLTNSNYFLFLHAITIPFIMFHWILGDNTCALTIVERGIRGIKKEEDNKDKLNDIDNCFTCRLIEPVYDFHKNHKAYSKLTWLIVIVMWLLTIYKLNAKYVSGDIATFSDLVEV